MKYLYILHYILQYNSNAIKLQPYTLIMDIFGAEKNLAGQKSI